MSPVFNPLRVALVAVAIGGIWGGAACTSGAAKVEPGQPSDVESDAGPPAPTFTNDPLKMSWDSPIVPTLAAAKDGAKTKVRIGGRVRTGQPFRFHVAVPRTNRPLTAVSVTVDGAQCSTRAREPEGFDYVSLCGIDIDRDPGDAIVEVNARVVGPSVPLADGGSPLAFTRTLRLKAVAGTYDERSLRVKKKFVEPPKHVQRRIERDRESIAAALAVNSARPTWGPTWVRPVPTEETSPFGTLRTYNDERKSRHLGLDLDGETGDPIVAIGAGQVVLVEQRYYSGGTVVIDHGESLFSLYFHMSRFDVKAGEPVKAGQLLGAVGKSGRVTGPHLHLSVKVGGHYIDPKTLLAFPPLKTAAAEKDDLRAAPDPRGG